MTTDPSWGSKKIGGQVYDLTHLDPMVVHVPPQGNQAGYKVHISFGMHTFTKEWDPVAHTPDYRMIHKQDERCFCPIRHGQSLHLPGIINGATVAYFSQRADFLLIDNIPSVTGQYAIFFKIMKASSVNFDARMFVSSAYEKVRLPPKNAIPSIPFATLVAKTIANEPISRKKQKNSPRRSYFWDVTPVRNPVTSARRRTLAGRGAVFHRHQQVSKYPRLGKASRIIFYYGPGALRRIFFAVPMP